MRATPLCQFLALSTEVINLGALWKLLMHVSSTTIVLGRKTTHGLRNLIICVAPSKYSIVKHSANCNFSTFSISTSNFRPDMRIFDKVHISWNVDFQIIPNNEINFSEKQSILDIHFPSIHMTFTEEIPPKRKAKFQCVDNTLGSYPYSPLFKRPKAKRASVLGIWD